MFNFGGAPKKRRSVAAQLNKVKKQIAKEAMKAELKKAKQQLANLKNKNI